LAREISSGAGFACDAPGSTSQRKAGHKDFTAAITSSKVDTTPLPMLKARSFGIGTVAARSTARPTSRP
jgi:hypothetical protein